MADWVLAVERAYVESATGEVVATATTGDLATARAALGAVASHYLAVGTPRSFGVILATAADAELARLSQAAHATWFAPRETRCATLDGSRCDVGTPTSIGEAFASDIVCVHAPIAIRAIDLRRGTHVNVLADARIDDDLARLATVTREVPGLGALAAGLVDGRQLDELTVFIVGDCGIALAALAKIVAP
ncbi:MAG: hypothetical protein ABI867_19980 [Kofleriaceae bacterium]